MLFDLVLHQRDHFDYSLTHYFRLFSARGYDVCGIERQRE